MIKKRQQFAFTLPTLLIISTVLMAIGAAVLQGTISIKNSLEGQFYEQLAREAAEAGVRQAQGCVAQDSTSWSELRPDTTCTGTTNGIAPAFVLQTATYRTTFTVPPIQTRADGSTIVTARGKTELLRRSTGAVYKTYNETVGQAVGATTMSVIPAKMATGGVAFDDTMSFMVGYDEQVYGMGSNGDGRLGDGTTTSRDTPVKFNLPAGLTAKKVDAAYHFTAVLASNGQVYMAGNNVSGQLGDGTTTSRSTPVRFQLPSGIFAVDVQVAGGSSDCSCGYNTYVLASNGRVYGAGNNTFGQLAGGPASSVPNPKLLPLPSGVTRVKKMATTRTTNNNNSFVIIGNNGNVYGIGTNTYYQLGSTNTANKTSFVQLALPNGVRAVDIKIGYYNTFVIAADAKVYGFGRALAGQLGDGTFTVRHATAREFNLPGSLTPQKLYTSSSSEVADTDGNEQNTTYVLASDHQVYGSGQNHKGQLSDGSTTNRSSPVKFQLPAGLTAVDLSTHYYTTCVLASDKQVYCSGENRDGQLGLGHTTNQTTAKKFPLPSGVTAVSVVVSRAQIYVTGSDGNIYAAGRNDDGELGDGSTTNQTTPVAVRRPVVPIVRRPIKADMSFISTQVIATDGRVYSVGRNLDGEFGNGTTSDPQLIPLQFQLPAGYAKTLRSGFHHTAVLSSDGQVYFAGRNNYYQFGIANPTNFPTPVKAPLENISSSLWARDVAVSSSPWSNTTAIHASNNQIYTAGWNDSGSVGNGTTSIVNQFSSAGRFQLPSGVTAMKMFFGVNNTTFVLGSNEVLYGAGNNEVGRLGIGNETNPITTPTQMLLPGGCYLEDMEPGTFVSYSLCRNGDVYSVGLDNQGQLCNNSTYLKQSVPVKVALPAGVYGVKLVVPKGANTGFVHILASDGNLYGCGDNGFGQLGDGTTTNRPTPVVADLPAGVSAVDAWPGQEAVFILGSNGNIYATGRNTSGQLGVGDITHRSTPTRVNLPAGVLGQWAVNQYALNSEFVFGAVDYFSGFMGSDGNFYTSGYNWHGQLGDGTQITRTSPVKFALPQPVPKPDIIF